MEPFLQIHSVKSGDHLVLAIRPPSQSDAVPAVRVLQLCASLDKIEIPSSEYNPPIN